MTKVLVFESDPKFAGELRTELGRLGCTVQVVDDGNVGLQAASSERPDLILLSIELPRMNGFSVCNKLKKDAHLKDVPLVIMSSESSEETFEQHRKLRTRAEDYVHKPIAFGELLQHIKPLVPLDGNAMDAEAISLDDVEVEEDETGVVSVRDPAPEMKPPPPPPPRSSKPSAGGKVDSEIDEFIGGAFDHLIQEDEATQIKQMAGPRSVPPPRLTPPPRMTPPPAPGRKPGSIAPASPSVPPPPVTDASLQAYRAIQPPPPAGADPAEVNRLRAELEHAKSEVVKLTKEAVSAHANASRLEAEAEGGREAATDMARLRRENDELRARSVSGKPGAVSSREFLDLREALNRKDKEILALRDGQSKKDKELIDLRDQTLVLEREKADQVDRILELERAREELGAQVDSLRSDRELAAKRADDFKARGEKVLAQLTQRDQELAAARQHLADAEQAHTQSLRDAAEEKARSIEATESEARMQLEAAVEEERHRVSSAAAAEAQRVANEYASAMEALKGANSAALAVAEQHRVDSLDQAAGQYAAEIEKLKRDHRASNEYLLDAKRQEIADLTGAHEQAMRAAAAAGEAKLDARERELEEHRESAIATVIAEHGEELKNERDANTRALEAKEAAWTAVKRELDGEIRTLSMDLEQTKERLEISEERAAALDAQLITQGTVLEQTKEQLDSTERERTRLEAELSLRTTERDQLVRDLGERTAQRDDLVHNLARRTDERDGLTEELATRTDERDAVTVELASSRELREKTDGRLREREAELRQKTEEAEGLAAELAKERSALEETREELAVARQRNDGLDADLGRTRIALDKARAKWGQDRTSLDTARKALAAAMTQLQEAEERPID